MSSQEQVRAMQFRIEPSLIPIKPLADINLPAQEDEDTQHALQPGEKPSDFIGQQTEGSGSETEQNTEF